jgi:hypothetical protein
MVPRSVHWICNCDQKFYLKVLCASEVTLSQSQLLLQLLAPTNLHLARIVGYRLFSLHVIHKEGLCLSSGDINRQMMMINNLIR